MFLSFQHPVEIPGVRLDQFMRAGFNSLRKHRGEPELDPLKFDRLLKKNVELVGLQQAMTKRFVNMNFSGGEKKKSELLQMSIMEPRLSILDEPDSGLDVDALRDVANCIKKLHTLENAVLLVTHYQRILNYVVPDQVHILVDGRVVRTGSKDLAHDIEANGYEQYEQAHT
jgi:Fe-S cluster assembly ATP-binding protein